MLNILIFFFPIKYDQPILELKKETYFSIFFPNYIINYTVSFDIKKNKMEIALDILSLLYILATNIILSGVVFSIILSSKFCRQKEAKKTELSFQQRFGIVIE